MYITQVEFNTPSYGELIYLRDLLLRKPIGLEFTPEDLSTEYNSTHIAAFSNMDELLGTLVMKPLDKHQVKMRQVAVFPFAQRKGIGQQMVAASERFAIANGFSEIVLSARVPAVPFYEKLNYEVVSDIYKEVGIDHYKMKKKLS
ncbi:MAG: GNAT family N-acetyltransferase [Saprospiraceae bacterium]|nr:GNAT family N-acetyltransferase [Saprospiraceae bacterium]